MAGVLVIVRAFNFAAGPATLPLPVLEQVREELPDWQHRGMSVMEVSHRSKAFIAVAESAEAKLRELLLVPPTYKVLFLQGGATGQFSGVALNLAAAGATVDYVNTGNWSKKAIGEARSFCSTVHVAADAGADGYNSVPPESAWKRNPGAAYLHYTPNETIGGVAFPFIPDAGAVPLVADYSSSILSEPLDVSRFGVIYAGAQKNIGPAGLVLVIVREDLLGRPRRETPSVLNWTQMAAEGSMSNTPPTFAWYMAGLVFQWIAATGGLGAMAGRNQRKAAALYAAIDSSAFYRNPVAVPCRSRMNVPFTLANPDLDKSFLAGAQAEGLMNLEGHRSVGGMRASIYNAMPEEGVAALVQYMKEFERRHG
jgi:phosphoserine aminotransferase